MSIFSYNFLDRSRKQDIGSLSDNFSKQGYDWNSVKKQLYNFAPENPPEPEKPKPNPSPPPLTRESSWNFFSNPKSEWEERRKHMVDDYRKEMQSKFQEKIIKDQKPKYIEKQEFYNSVKQGDKFLEDSQSTLSYNKSFIITNPHDNALTGVKEKIEYYSPQMQSKYQKDRTIGKETSPNRPLQTVFEYSKANMTSDQNKILRERQLEEWKKSVQEQLQERNKAKEELKSKKMLEDKLEEVKIKREIEDLHKKYKQELRYESGLTLEDNYKPQPKSKVQETQETREVYNNYKPVQTDKKQAYKENKPVKKKEDYRMNHENTLQEAGIKDITLKIRSEATYAAKERQEVLNDLERMKAEIRSTRIFDPFAPSSLYAQAYKPPENRSIQLSYAGKGIINNNWRNTELQGQSTYVYKKPHNTYNDIESADIKNQLSKLDEILSLNIEKEIKEEDDEEGKEFVMENETENYSKDDKKYEKTIEEPQVSRIFTTEFPEEINKKLDENEGFDG